MKWHLTKRSYYADFVTAPLLGIASLTYALHAQGLTFALACGLWFGALLMTFVEYAVHRWLFHRTYRREHWRHHMKPAEYIGVPGWQTMIYFVIAYALAMGLGVSFGTGLFVGVLAGYLMYIVSHDRFHHGDPQSWTGYWARQAHRHMLHHAGKETNFGVSSPLWDRILGTYTP